MQQKQNLNCLSFKILSMKNLIILITVLSIFFSCKKSSPYEPFVIPCTLTQDSSLAKQYIKGTWEWVEEKRASRTQADYIYLTPKTEGYTQKMIISDSILKFYRNNELIETKIVKIKLFGEITGTNFPEDSLTVLAIYRISDGVRESFAPIKICNSFLVQQFQFVSSLSGEKIWKKL